MDSFRFILFGISGVSLIFWVAVIALWHTYMFPTLFNEDKSIKSTNFEDSKIISQPILGNLIKNDNFRDRFKYSMRSLVIADFSQNEYSLKLNKLYTALMISISFATFTLISYGLSSSITTIN